MTGIEPQSESASVRLSRARQAAQGRLRPVRRQPQFGQ